MLNLNSVLVFSENPKALVEFYQKILGKESEWSGGDFVGWQVGDGYLTVGPHSEVRGRAKEPQRVMFNLETDDVAGEFARIKGLGAKVIQEPYQPGEEPTMWIATFADPDGNYFQLMSVMKKPN